MNQIDNAVRTRSYTIEINVTENELFDIMEKNLVNILPNVDMATKKEVFDFIKSEYKSSEESINVRTLIKAIKIRLSGAPNWKKLASKYA
jgi:predicted DNA binding CopG/RHH family protein